MGFFSSLKSGYKNTFEFNIDKKAHEILQEKLKKYRVSSPPKRELDRSISSVGYLSDAELIKKIFEISTPDIEVFAIDAILRKRGYTRDYRTGEYTRC